jgi:hypothetical protein
MADSAAFASIAAHSTVISSADSKVVCFLISD